VIEQLYVVAFLAGVLTIFFDVAYLSYLPSLVRKEELLEGNSKLTASSAAAEAGAFGAAGWLVQLLSGPGAVLADAVSFLFSALFVGLIRRPEPVAAPAAQREGMRQEIGEGIRTVLRSPILRSIAVAGVIVDFSFRVFGTVFLLYATRELGFRPGVLGLIFAVGGASSLLGALAARRGAARLGIGPAMVFGVMIMGISMLFVPAAQDATLLGAALLVAQQLFGDGAFTVYEVNQVSLRQSITPDRLLGRVNAGIRFAGLAAMLLGAVTGGLLGETLGLRGTLVVGSVGIFLAGVWLMLSPVWRLREPLPGPEGAPAETA